MLPALRAMGFWEMDQKRKEKVSTDQTTSDLSQGPLETIDQPIGTHIAIVRLYT